MLVIRLARVGRKKIAQYRIVAADSRRAATGRYVARLGHYNPHTKEAVINQDELQAYLKKGAQPSGSVVKLLKKQKISVPKWAEANLKVRKRAPKQKGEAEAETQSAPAKEVVEEPKPAEADDKPETKADSAADKPAQEPATATKTD